MENLAPKMEKRYAAMEQIAKAGILTGTMMPSLTRAERRLGAIGACPETQTAPETGLGV
jgi:hypothetical protein